MVADHMALWVCRQHARLDRPSRRLPMQTEMPPQPEPADPWERAIAQASREIRDLIETGDRDHDEMTGRWVEQWAADIYSETPGDGGRGEEGRGGREGERAEGRNRRGDWNRQSGRRGGDG